MNVTELDIERYINGDLDDGRRRAIDEAQRINAALRTRIDSVRASNAEILSQYPPKVVAESILARARLPKTGNTSRLPFSAVMKIASPIAIAACAAFIFVLPQLRHAGGIRSKGLAPSLIAFKKSGAATEALSNGATVHAGDIVQLAYFIEGRRYGVIFSIDGNGTVTEHYPDGATNGLVHGRVALLSASYTLDDAPKYEVFFLVTSRMPIDTKDIIAKARSLSKDPDRAVIASRDVFTGNDIIPLILYKEPSGAVK